MSYDPPNYKNLHCPFCGNTDIQVGHRCACGAHYTSTKVMNKDNGRRNPFVDYPADLEAEDALWLTEQKEMKAQGYFYIISPCHGWILPDVWDWEQFIPRRHGYKFMHGYQEFRRMGPFAKAEYQGLMLSFSKTRKTPKKQIIKQQTLI